VLLLVAILPQLAPSLTPGDTIWWAYLRLPLTVGPAAFVVGTVAFAAVHRRAGGRPAAPRPAAR
jgi:hypothetical protein